MVWRPAPGVVFVPLHLLLTGEYPCCDGAPDPGALMLVTPPRSLWISSHNE